MNILFLENDDSFSWNVVDALPFSRQEISVLSVRQRGVMPSDLDGVDALVIGPGPMDPERAGLIGIVREAAARALPTLGVCLGHQALGLAFGARLVRTPPVHGKTAEIELLASRWFAGCEGAWRVMRYHSLAVEAVVAPLTVTAQTRDGVVMALEHRTLPMAGVQFHPDSYATVNGARLLDAFFRNTRVLRGERHA